MPLSTICPFCKTTFGCFDASKASAVKSSAVIPSKPSKAIDTTPGNISYYVREGRRVGVEDLVFSIDESGQMQALLEQNTGESN